MNIYIYILYYLTLFGFTSLAGSHMNLKALYASIVCSTSIIGVVSQYGSNLDCSVITTVPGNHAGAYCHNNQYTYCPPGYWCIGAGQIQPCPAGT